MAFQELKPGDSPLKVPAGIATCSSLKALELEGYTAFSLGPVYVYAGVNESIPSRFCQENIPGRKSDVYGTTIHFERPVIARCQNWNYILDVMDTKNFQWFKQWMLANQFASRENKTFFVPRHYRAPLLDPIALDKLEKQIPTALDVFTVSGLKGLMRPVCELTAYTQAKSYIDFNILPPEEDVVVMGRTTLKLLNEV